MQWKETHKGHSVLMCLVPGAWRTPKLRKCELPHRCDTTMAGLLLTLPNLVSLDLPSTCPRPALDLPGPGHYGREDDHLSLGVKGAAWKSAASIQCLR
jgi:hypothetical protein